MIFYVINNNEYNIKNRINQTRFFTNIIGQRIHSLININNHMQQILQYGNNIIPLSASTNINTRIYDNRQTNWLVISPKQLVLHGMLLTGSFNIQNSHEHLSVNFNIKPILKGQQLPFVEIFPQRGNIMRGEVKKIRVKFSKQFTPQQQYNNGFMILRVFVNLNTEWNKQYMITNKLRGWSQIKDLPIEQYELPIIISDQYLELKQNIRKSVVFESQFGKVSQQMSSLYGDQKFQVPAAQIDYSRNLLQNKSMKMVVNNGNNRLSGRNIFNRVEERKSMGSFSENKRSRSSAGNSNGAMREVYFGNEPKIVQSKVVEPNSYSHLKRSSMSQKHASTIIQNNDVKVNIPKIPSKINNPFSTQQQPLFKQFSDRKLPTSSRLKLESQFQNHQDSQISILKSLEKRNSQVKKYDLQRVQYQSGFKNNNNSHYRKDEEQEFKDFNTVAHHFDETQHGGKHSNKRSIEIIVLAIIAGFFVALGSNIARILH